MEEYCLICNHDICLKRVPIFASLSHTVLKQILPFIGHKTYVKGSIILHEGDTLNALVNGKIN